MALHKQDRPSQDDFSRAYSSKTGETRRKRGEEGKDGLEAFLTACADNGGQPLTDLTPFLPWTMDDARREALKQPLPMTEQRPPNTS